MARFVVRYSEFERYDITKDAEMVRLMATTDKGSYWAEVRADIPGNLRRDKQAFKELVVEYIRTGRHPCEVRLV